MSNIGFKVVSCDENNKLWSYIVENYRVQYKVGKRAYPLLGCGSLFLFDTIKNAVAFASINNYNVKLFGVEYKRTHRRKARCFGCTTSRIYSFTNKYIQYAYEEDVPQGTILADWIKLIEEINIE